MAHPEKLTVKNYYKEATTDGKVFFICSMSDGSEWKCDVDGNNWEKVSYSHDQLTEKFNNRKS